MFWQIKKYILYIITYDILHLSTYILTIMPINKKKIGNLGEEISSIFLKNKGFKILKRNWEKRPIGEIDIIAKKDNILYFVEVKTTASTNDKYSPLEHLDKNKMKKFQRIVNHYLIEKNLIDTDYKISAILCYLNSETKKAKINFIPDFY